MLFNSLPFVVFFTLVWAIARALPARRVAPMLLTASLVFYTLWYPPYLLLLLADITINYAFLCGIAGEKRRRLWLGCSLMTTLGLLSFFKYAGMLVELALPVLKALSFPVTPPEILLPLGISFFSFQICAFSIDTYRAEPGRPPAFARYLLFVCFFPQLIAGPIVRGRELLPQLERGPAAMDLRGGGWLVVIGLLKKVVASDLLLAPFVDSVFKAPGVGSAWFHWVALYSFAFQIYFDFSGYTDIARGLARLLGYELPRNFRQPYLSRSPAEFWRRWHVTLSRWLRDYLYIPLGGNRRGPSRRNLNLLITMLLGGLWHGAALTFVVWGFVHGVILMATRKATASSGATCTPLAWSQIARILTTFHLVVLPWVLFRAPDLPGALRYYGALVAGDYGAGFPILQALIVAICGLFHLLERLVVDRWPSIRRRIESGALSAFVEGVCLGILFVLIVVGWNAGQEFIYFQF